MTNPRARLEKLEALARRSPFPSEREAALLKVNSLRASLGMRPLREKSKSAPASPKPPRKSPPAPTVERRVFRGAAYDHVHTSSAKRYYVDVSDTNSIGEAFKKAFKVAFEDVKAEHRKGNR